MNAVIKEFEQTADSDSADGSEHEVFWVQGVTDRDHGQA
jgi:hypothetical protein